MNPAQAYAVLENPESSTVLDDCVSTGSIGLDRALGGGFTGGPKRGWPLGMLSVLYGLPSSGKSTLALCGIREMQRKGEIVLYVNSDNDFSARYARSIGINTGELLVITQLPPVKDRCPCGFVVIDSVKSEADASAALEFSAYHDDVTVLAVSQAPATFSNPFGDTIAMASFLSETSVRVRLSQDNDCTWAYVERNSWSSRYGGAAFRLTPAGGIDPVDEIFRIALFEGIITHKGSWYYLGDDCLGQGEAVAQRAMTPGQLSGIRCRLGL